VKHIIVALMQDRPGVLNRVTSLFRRRNFNIESLAVGHSETPGISRMTVVVDADVEQVVKQLYRLVDVLKVSDVTEDSKIEREIAFIKVNSTPQRRGEIAALARVFHARVIDVAPTTMILEITASPAKVENFVSLLRPFGIKEMMRSGRIAMVRGSRGTRAAAEEGSAAAGNGADALAAAR
jgi:acetolactate synthase I/III small subunit